MKKIVLTAIAIVLGLNTVLVPAYWELMEPIEGTFDFTLIDRTIEVARREHLHVGISTRPFATSGEDI